VLHALDSSEMRHALTKARKPARAGDDPEVLQAELDELADAAGRGDIPVREYLRARRPLEERRKRALAATKTDAALAPVLGSPDICAACDRLDDVEAKRAILGILTEKVTVKPASGPGTKFDPERIGIVWRV